MLKLSFLDLEDELDVGLNTLIRPFHMSHLQSLDLRKHDQEIYPHMQVHYPEGLSFSAIIDGRVVACFGLILMHRGVAAAWLTVDKHITKHKIMFCKSVRHFFPFAANELNLHRIQVIVDSTYKTALNWIELYNFKREGLLVEWFPDRRDGVLFARVFK